MVIQFAHKMNVAGVPIDGTAEIRAMVHSQKQRDKKRIQDEKKREWVLQMIIFFLQVLSSMSALIGLLLCDIRSPYVSFAIVAISFAIVCSIPMEYRMYREIMSEMFFCSSSKRKMVR